MTLEYEDYIGMYVQNQFEKYEFIDVEYDFNQFRTDNWSEFRVDVKLKGHINKYEIYKKPFIFTGDNCIEHKIHSWKLQKYTQLSYYIVKSDFKTEVKQMIREEKLKSILEYLN